MEGGEEREEERGKYRDYLLQHYVTFEMSILFKMFPLFISLSVYCPFHLLWNYKHKFPMPIKSFELN